MGDNFVSNDQAAGVGGSSQPSGVQGDNTFQDNNVKQLLVMVRYKPAPSGAFDTAAAGGMLDGITGAIEGAASAAESVMDSIPGLNMFIKEEPKDSKSEKEYSYYNDYSGWDNVFQKMTKGLKEMNPENETDTFEFSSTDSAGRKSDAQKLLGKVKSKISGWSKYTARIHFIGIGQGGNVANECATLLAKDSQFSSEKWFVKSIVYIGTPLYKTEHVVDKACFKKQGAAFSFTNTYDLTQNAVECFEKNDKLLKLIQEANKKPLSLAVGKVKLRVLQVLAIILSGMHISGGDTSELDKFGKIKDEIKGAVDDILDLIKKITNEGASFLKLGDLPEFSKITNGYGDIPNQVGDKVSAYVDNLTKSVKDQAKSANMSLSPKDLAGLLSCLCPLFDKIAESMAVFKYEEKTGVDLAKQIIDQAGITKVYAPAPGSGTTLPVDEDYIKKVTQSNTDGKPDRSAAFISHVRDLLTQAAEKQSDVSAMNDDQKMKLAQAIGCIVQPMLTSKKELYQKLLHVIPFDLHSMAEGFNSAKLMGFPASALKTLGIDFPDDLKQSISKTDNEISRITGYFEKQEFNAQEDSLYFIFNSHNLLLKKMYGPIANYVDRQTGYLDYMKSKGFDNEYTLTDNSYKQGSKDTKNNVLPAQEVPANS
jgi:hypothetical protein